jgi:protein-S-isoprenylcysteine O-methyltransferase Ste14
MGRQHQRDRDVVVPREERYLDARFGSTYGAYKSAVRRWL